MMDEKNRKAYEAQLELEEYKIWKKSAPFLYDLMITHVLETPILTVQWLPIFEVSDDPDVTINKLVIGTNSPDQSENYLMIAKVKIPKDEVLLSLDEYLYFHEAKSGINTIGQSNDNIEIEKKILHEGEVNKARYMPQHPNFIATKTVSGQVHLFNINLTYKKDKPTPEASLIGHEKEGYGLEWNPNKKGEIVSSGEDGKIIVWNVDAESENKQRQIPATCTYTSQSDPINDVGWNKKQKEVFASASENGVVQLWDTRDQKKTTTIITGSPTDTIDFSPTDQHLLLSGGDSMDVVLWDIRKPTTRVYTFVDHSDKILKVEWSPDNQAVFSSCSVDKTVKIWDIGRINASQTEEEKKDGPPELLFIHGGHRGPVIDFSWSSNNMVASIENRMNSLHIWSMAEYIYKDDYQ